MRSQLQLPHIFKHIYLSKVYDALGRNPDAEEALRQAYIHNPINSQAATLYAEVLVKHGDITQALKILTEVINRNCTYNPALQLRMKILE